MLACLLRFSDARTAHLYGESALERFDAVEVDRTVDHIARVVEWSEGEREKWKGGGGKDAQQEKQMDVQVHFTRVCTPFSTSTRPDGLQPTSPSAQTQSLTG